MDFKIEKTTKIIGTSEMNERAVKFCEALGNELDRSPCITVCKAIHGDDGVWIEFCSAPQGKRTGVDYENNRFVCQVEGFSSGRHRLKLEAQINYYNSKAKDAPKLRGKTARDELVIKAIANHINKLSLYEPWILSDWMSK